MLVFRKIWRAFFSWNTRFEIRPFTLLPTSLQIFIPTICFFFLNKVIKFRGKAGICLSCHKIKAVLTICFFTSNPLTTFLQTHFAYITSCFLVFYTFLTSDYKIILAKISKEFWKLNQNKIGLVDDRGESFLKDRHHALKYITTCKYKCLFLTHKVCKVEKIPFSNMFIECKKNVNGIYTVFL